MKMIEELLQGATALGACNKTDGVDTLDKLVALFTSPQGREFCFIHNYPSREQWNKIRDTWSAQQLAEFGVFIDLPSDHTEMLDNPVTTIAVGDSTHVNIRYRGADEMHRVILMHGATAAIDATHYAVFEINASDGCGYSVAKDNTVIQL